MASRLVPRHSRKLITSKNNKPLAFLSWADDVVATRLFIPVLERHVREMWTRRASEAETSIANKQSGMWGGPTVKAFSLMDKNGWKDMVSDTCAGYAAIHKLDLNKEAFSRRLYGITHGETNIVHVSNADLIITALGGRLEEEKECPMLPGSPKRVMEWFETWLDRPASKAEARSTMEWVTRFIFSNQSFDPTTAPEVIGKAYLD